MPTEAIKDRFHRAIEQAGRTLAEAPHSWDVSYLKNHAFHIEAVRPREVLRIRIVLDRMTVQDVRLVSERRLPENFTRAIWLKKRGSKRFEIHEIEYNVNTPI